MARVREKLIRAGLWDSEDFRDPEADEAAAEKLLESVKTLLKPGVIIFIIEDPGNPPVFRPIIRKHAGTHALEMMGIIPGSSGSFTDRNKAICVVALALPKFLKEHPELAAPVV